MVRVIDCLTSLRMPMGFGREPSEKTSGVLEFRARSVGTGQRGGARLYRARDRDPELSC